MFALNMVREQRQLIEAKRSATIDGLEATANKALNSSRAFTASEAREVDSLRAQLAEIDAELHLLDEREAELTEVRERTTERAKRPALNMTVPQNPWTGTEHGRAGSLSDVRSQAITAVERAVGAPDHARSRVVDAIEAGDEQSEPLARWAVATSDPEYLRAFHKIMTDPTTAHVRMTDTESAAFQRVAEVQRAMSLTDNAGGYMVPFSLDPAILLTNNGTQDPIRDIARVVTITTDVWHGVSSAGVTASWDAEAAEVSDDAPTLAQPTVTPERLTAFVPFSIEAGEDALNFAAEMSRVITDSFEVAEGSGFWTGAGHGSNQPMGVVTKLDATAGSEVATTTGDTFVVADVYKLHEALPARFRRNATWAGNVQVLNKIRRFGEGTTGSNSAFWADLGAGQPPLLLGRPAVEASGMETFDSTGAENILIFGDFSRYVIADRVGTTIELIPHLFATANNRPSGQRGFFAYKRTSGDVTTPEAFRLLQS